jgi:hypothetical protein
LATDDEEDEHSSNNSSSGPFDQRNTSNQSGESIANRMNECIIVDNDEDENLGSTNHVLLEEPSAQSSEVKAEQLNDSVQIVDDDEELKNDSNASASTESAKTPKKKGKRLYHYIAIDHSVAMEKAIEESA